MACFIVTYEIADKKRRQQFEERLKEYGVYCPIHENAWAIISNQKSYDIITHLMQFIITSDRLFVIRSGTDGAWYNLYGEAHADWLKQRL